MSDSQSFDHNDKFGLQEDYNHLFENRTQRRERRVRKSQVAKRIRREIDIQNVADVGALEGAFRISYTPAEHEGGWLLGSLRQFFTEELLTDLLYMVKGGKEANVYCGEVESSAGRSLLAVKVYRPHQFRQIRNDAQYREGRHTLAADGSAIVNDHRTFRAIARKSKHGRQTQRVSWLAHEYETQLALFHAGAAVPEPLSMAENAILMEYIGDENNAAPTLSQVRLDDGECWPLFKRIIRTVESLLKLGKIHGDLSAYNILYWEGDVYVIDFPQAVNAVGNQSAAEILLRDITRVCDYFGRQGLRIDATSLTDALWRSYIGPSSSQLPVALADYRLEGDA